MDRTKHFRNIVPLFIELIPFFLVFSFFQINLSLAAERKIAKGPINIEADSVAYERDTDTYSAKGNVVITFTGGFLKADRVALNKTTGNARAEGDVFIKSDDDTLSGERVKFNVISKTGIVYKGKLFFAKNHFFINGEEIEKSGEATYHLKNITATTCDNDLPAWRFTGRELDVTIDGYGILKHGTFQVKNFPLLYLPYMVFPAKTTRQSGFLPPRISSSRDKHGCDIEVPFYWAISENTDATFYQRYMDKRGFKEGMEFRYIINEDSFGTFYADYLNDIKEITETEEDGLSRDWQDSRKRWSFYLNHETTFSPGFYFRTDLAKVSDNWYFKDFSDHNYYLKNYSRKKDSRFSKISFLADESLESLDSTARLVKEWELFNLTALVQYTDNFESYDNDSTLQRYPEITFTGLQRPVFGTPLNFELDSLIANYHRTEGDKGSLYDLYPKFSLPLNLGDYLQFTPEIGVRETMWDAGGFKEPTKEEHGNRDIFDIGAELSTRVHRVFDIGGETVDKIQHEIKPELTYTYIPYIYQEDQPDFVERMEEENSLTYSLLNTFVARLKENGGGISYREFLRIKLSQTYDIKEARRSGPKKRPFGNVDMELEFNPFRYISFDTDAGYNVNSGDWEETNFDLRLSDWRGDSVRLEYRYTQHMLEETNIFLKAVVTDSVDLMYVLRKNQLDDVYMEREYGLNYHRQCWGLEFTCSDDHDDRTWMVVFYLKGLGKVGKASMEPG